MMISIITVNYKQKQASIDFLHCARFLKSNVDFEVILVDNEADLENQRAFEAACPGLKYLPITENIGFGAANNVAVKHAQGDYYLFLNNDLEFDPNFLNDLLKDVHRISDFGIISPLIYYFDQPETLQYAGYSKISSLTGRNKIVKEHSSNQIIPTAYAHGAAMLMKASNFKKMEGFMEDYFLYYEEIDLAARLEKHALTCFVNQNAKVFHKESLSTGKGSPLKTYFLTRNRIVFMKRNYSNLQFGIFIMSFFLISFPKFVLGNIFREPLQLKSFINACIDALRLNLGRRAEAWS